MAYFSLFRGRLRKILSQTYVEHDIGKLKMIKWNRFDTNSKNE